MYLILVLMCLLAIFLVEIAYCDFKYILNNFSVLVTLISTIVSVISTIVTIISIIGV